MRVKINRRYSRVKEKALCMESCLREWENMGLFGNSIKGCFSLVILKTI